MVSFSGNEKECLKIAKVAIVIIYESVCVYILLMIYLIIAIINIFMKC